MTIASIYQRTILYVAVPFILAALIAIVWLVICFCKRKFDKYCGYVFGTITVVFFLIQDDIYIALFQVFNCFQVNSEERLRMDINEICF